MTDDPDRNPYSPGTAEHAEWQAIRYRHEQEIAARGGVAPPRAVPLADLERHAEHLATLAADGVIFGPDCSQYQGSPAWGTVKASGCAIGFYKVSEGRTFQDPSHQWNKTHAPAAGLVAGGYHFLYFSQEYVDNPKLWAAQASWFAELVDPQAGHILDVEAAATAGHHLGVKEWVAEYRRLFPHHPLGLYANLALWQNRSRMPYDPTDLFDYIWHAGIGNGYYTGARGTIAQQWAATPSLVNSFASHGYPTCKLWQITDHAQVPGVGGSFCDGNAFQGSTAELIALLTNTEDDVTPDDINAIAAKVASSVDDLLDTKLRAYLSENWVHNPVMAAPVGTVQPATETNAKGEKWTAYRVSPIGMINEVFRKLTPTGAVMAALAQVAAQTDTVEGSLAGIKAAVADDPTLQQLVDALHAALGSGDGGQLTRADVEAALADVVARTRFVAAPATTP